MCCVLAAPLAQAETKVVAILGFAANDGARDHAPGVESLVATEIGQVRSLKVISHADVLVTLGAERQQQLLGEEGGAGCTATTCITEVASAVGARYVINGRVDRFGTRYIVTAGLFDTQSAGTVARVEVEASDEDELPAASRMLANRALQALTSPGGIERLAATPRVFGTLGNFSLGLRMGNAFLTNIAAFNLSGDLELGYRFEPDWVAFLQVGVTFVRPPSETLPDEFAIVPSVIGARHLYLIQDRFQPYWGLGLGVQLTIADKFGPFQSTGPLPTVIGFLGFQYFATRHLLLGIEGSMNLAQATLGLTGTGTLGTGFNLDLNGSVGWRF